MVRSGYRNHKTSNVFHQDFIQAYPGIMIEELTFVGLTLHRIQRFSAGILSSCQIHVQIMLEPPPCLSDGGKSGIGLIFLAEIIGKVESRIVGISMVEFGNTFI